jgi:hypothetical protein
MVKFIFRRHNNFDMKVKTKKKKLMLLPYGAIFMMIIPFHLMTEIKLIITFLIEHKFR